jgi:thiol:disulfide interchange protein DsbD
MEFLVSLQTYVQSLPPGAKLAAALLAGFIGGIVLNVMPCVLPVLSLKVYDVVEKAKVDPKQNRLHGIAYMVGILLFYLPVGLVVGLTKAPANKMFQHPPVTAGLCLLMFALGLNALGVFEITISANVEDKGDGFRASTFKGLLAAVMSIPCSAPMLGIALGVAVAADVSAVGTILIYTMVGLGLAFPFLLISFVPKLAAKMPKPGAWMDTAKKFMGFTLMAASVWLFGVLRNQISAGSAQWFLYFMVLLSVALWVQGKFGGFEHSSLRRLVVKGSAVVVVVGGALFVNNQFAPPPKPAATAAISPDAVKVNADGKVEYHDPPVVKDGKIAWIPFSSELVKANLERGRPVFMDFTADWCLNCQANDKQFVDTEPVQDKLSETNILPMKADFTNEDEEIEKWIKDLGRGGIPIYVVYLPDGTNILLPESINKKMLIDALAKASKKFPKDKYKLPKGIGGDEDTSEEAKTAANADKSQG